MPNSSTKTTRQKKSPKPSKSTANSREDLNVESQQPLPRPVAMSIPVPDAALAEVKLRKFLARYKIGIRQYELTAKIGDIIQRGIGGRTRAIDCLKFSNNPQARQLLEFSQKLSYATQESIPIEALCLAAGVDTTTIAGALVMAARDVSRMESALIAMREHPNVVSSTAFYAGLADNSKDREMMHKAVGFLPTPKGSSVNVNIFGDKKESAEDDDDGPTIDELFVSDPLEMENWGESRRKLLEAGK